jgi:hypothetical protein
LDGGVGDPSVQLLGGVGGEGDDEELLALEGRCDGVLVVVVDLDYLDARRELTVAVLASETRDGVFAGLDEGLGKGATDATSGLPKSERAKEVRKLYLLR